jgi:hypothetical protein
MAALRAAIRVHFVGNKADSDCRLCNHGFRQTRASQGSASLPGAGVTDGSLSLHTFTRPETSPGLGIPYGAGARAHDPA